MQQEPLNAVRSSFSNAAVLLFRALDSPARRLVNERKVGENDSYRNEVTPGPLGGEGGGLGLSYVPFMERRAVTVASFAGKLGHYLVLV